MNIFNKIHNWTQSGPNGNDKQWLPQALMLGGSALASAYGAYQQNKALKTQPIGPGQIAGYMAPVQANINQQMAGQQQMAGLGQSMMDPQSAYNLRQKGFMQEQGANQQALQAILNQRQAAASGVSSGILAGQQRAQGQQVAQSLGSQYQNMLAQNRAQGLGLFGNAQTLLGNINRQQLGVSENIAQAGIAQNQAQMAEEMRQKQAQAAGWGAVSSGLSGAATGYHQAEMTAPTYGEYGSQTNWVFDPITGKPMNVD